MKRLILLAVAFFFALNVALFAQATQQTSQPPQKPAVTEPKKAVADTAKKAGEKEEKGEVKQAEKKVEKKAKKEAEVKAEKKAKKNAKKEVKPKR